LSTPRKGRGSKNELHLRPAVAKHHSLNQCVHFLQLGLLGRHFPTKVPHFGPQGVDFIGLTAPQHHRLPPSLTLRSARCHNNAASPGPKVWVRKSFERGYVERGSYLLIENLSRADIVTAQGLFLQLVGSGINLVTLTSGEAYSAERFQREPEAIFLVVLELIRANRESTRKSQLVGDAKARKKKRLAEHGIEGKPYTRQTPAWIHVV
jgi:hypothetical protein